MPDQSIEEISASLYAMDPTRFVAARAEAVRQARATGDRALATALGRLRRPTVSAWAVNLLVRSARVETAELVRLGEELRVAQRHLQAAQLRRLNQRRRELIGTLSRRARQLATAAGHPLSGPAVAEVEQSLAAALADAESARAVCSGRLTRPLQHIGLGTEPLTTTPLAGVEQGHSSAPPASPSVPPAQSAPPAALEDDVSPVALEDELARQRRRRDERLQRDLARAELELADAVARAAHADQQARQAAQRCADLDRRLAQLQRERDDTAQEHTEAQRRAQSAVRVRDEAERRVLRLTEERRAAR